MYSLHHVVEGYFMLFLDFLLQKLESWVFRHSGLGFKIYTLYLTVQLTKGKGRKTFAVVFFFKTLIKGEG